MEREASDFALTDGFCLIDLFYKAFVRLELLQYSI